MALSCVLATPDDRPLLHTVRWLMTTTHPTIFPRSAHKHTSYSPTKRKKIMTDRYFFFLLDDRGNPRGKVHCTPWITRDKKRDDTQGMIYGLYVHPSYQGQWYGKLLLSTLIDHSKQTTELTHLHLTVHKDNTYAYERYSKQGFCDQWLDQEKHSYQLTYLLK